MSYVQGEYKVISKENLAKDIYSFKVLTPDIASIAVAGQFVHIKANGFTLRRPISICEIDRAANIVRIVFEVRGDGTRELAKIGEGELIDIIGPLGHGFTLLDPSKKAITIGGGIGTPPMLELARYYGENATAITGFRSANAVILNEDFRNAHARTMLCTNDGTAGAKGFVTTALEKRLSSENADIIYACGPHLMLKGVIELARKYGIECEVSLEERMGCGVGACLVCACKTVKNGEEYFAHVCKDGPVFNADEIVL